MYKLIITLPYKKQLTTIKEINSIVKIKIIAEYKNCFMRELKITIIITSICFLLACNNSKVKNKIDHTGDTSTNDMHTNATNDTMQITIVEKENEMMMSMMKNMGEMDNITMTNNFDIDFANMMSIHHKAAIDMSELEIGKGGDVQMIEMAKKIIMEQNGEITQLKNFVAIYKKDTTYNNLSQKNTVLVDEMKSMMDKMHNMKLTGNIDDDYVMLMIPHHVSAIKMAKDEIAYGKVKELKSMAQKMIATQNKEIATFVAWSTKLK